MLSFKPLHFIDGVQDAMISPYDRGFAYGDGVFETLSFDRGELYFLDAHLQRLFSACETLAIPLDHSLLRQRLDQGLKALADIQIPSAVVKIMVTRGVGGRGYGVKVPLTPCICVLLNPPAQYPIDYSQRGVNLFECQTKLGRNESLAGLKHLNKLENVLARAEWSDAQYAEGLMFDEGGLLIEGVSSNVFIEAGGRLITPSLQSCGVAGIMRQFILDKLAPRLELSVDVRAIELAELQNADAVLVCNSLAGIWPVLSYGSCQWSPGRMTRLLQNELDAAKKVVC
jgi:4-amino-4-deoxychorismate lyase